MKHAVFVLCMGTTRKNLKRACKKCVFTDTIRHKVQFLDSSTITSDFPMHIGALYLDRQV
jgi:hypothetical protein